MNSKPESAFRIGVPSKIFSALPPRALRFSIDTIDVTLQRTHASQKRHTMKKESVNKKFSYACIVIDKKCTNYATCFSPMNFLKPL